MLIHLDSIIYFSEGNYVEHEDQSDIVFQATRWLDRNGSPSAFCMSVMTKNTCKWFIS